MSDKPPTFAPPEAPPFRHAEPVVPADAVPLLGPGAAAAITGSEYWVRSPNCPNNATDCRITITMTPVTTPVPPPTLDGSGTQQPPMSIKAQPHGSCSVCKLSWTVTQGPLGPNDLPPLTPYPPPVLPTTTVV
jgi:hypothetical protein